MGNPTPHRLVEVLLPVLSSHHQRGGVQLWFIVVNDETKVCLRGWKAVIFKWHHSVRRHHTVRRSPTAFGKNRSVLIDSSSTEGGRSFNDSEGKYGTPQTYYITTNYILLNQKKQTVTEQSLGQPGLRNSKENSYLQPISDNKGGGGVTQILNNKICDGTIQNITLSSVHF